MEHYRYDDKEQTISLTSDARASGEDNYDFSNHLANEVQFSGEWEVALDSLTYTKGSATNWSEHATHWTVLIESTAVQLRRQYQITPTLYANVISDVMIRTISSTLQLINAIIVAMISLAFDAHAVRLAVLVSDQHHA